MGYDLSIQAMLKMSDKLEALTSNYATVVEFPGTPRDAHYLRQAMASAQYHQHTEFKGLKETWKISFNLSGKIICTRKKLDSESYRVYKFVVKAMQVMDIFGDYMDGKYENIRTIHFPHVTPTSVVEKYTDDTTINSKIVEGMFDKSGEVYAKFKLFAFNETEGLVIVRRIPTNGEVDK